MVGLAGGWLVFLFFLLSFRGSCLVSSSLSGLWQFKFVCCFCLTPFLWGKSSDLLASPLLLVCCDGLLIVFQFCLVVCLWMLLNDSVDELCVPLPALFQAMTYHQPSVDPSAFPAFVY
jgi:hypothetical protein